MQHLHRLTPADFAERTQPIVHPLRGDAHPQIFSGIVDVWDQPELVNERAEAQHSVICGDSAWDRLVIAMCLVACGVGLALLTGCGGGDPDEDDPAPEAKCTQVAPPPGKPTTTPGLCA